MDAAPPQASPSPAGEASGLREKRRRSEADAKETSRQGAPTKPARQRQGPTAALALLLVTPAMGTGRARLGVYWIGEQGHMAEMDDVVPGCSIGSDRSGGFGRGGEERGA